MPIRLVIWYFEEVSPGSEVKKNPFQLDLPNLNLTGYELKQRLSQITQLPEKDLLISTTDKLIIDGELKLKNYQLRDNSVILLRKSSEDKKKIVKNLSLVFLCGVAFGVGYYGSCWLVKNYLGRLKEVPNLFKKN